MSFEVESLNSWKEAEKHFSAPEWKYVTGEAQGNLTSYLSQKYPNKYQGVWNKLVKEAKPKVEQIVVPHINSSISKENINPVFGDCVKGGDVDIVNLSGNRGIIMMHEIPYGSGVVFHTF